MRERKIKMLSPHCGYFEYGENDCPNIGFIEGKKCILVIDGGNSEENAAEFMGKLKIHEKGKKMQVLLTHFHWDHVCGIVSMPAQVIAGEHTYQEIVKMQKEIWNKEKIEEERKRGQISSWTAENMIKEQKKSRKVPAFRIPDMVIEGRICFPADDLNCIYEPLAGSHCREQYGVYVPKERILYIGDVLWPYMDCEEEKWYYSISEFKVMGKQLLAYDAEWYLESHAKPIHRKKLEQWLKRMINILNLVRANRGETIEQILEKLPKELREAEIGYDTEVYRACMNCVE